MRGRRGEEEKRRIMNIGLRISNACHVKCDVGAYFTMGKSEERRAKGEEA